MTVQQMDDDGLVIKSEKTFNEQTSAWQTEKRVYNANNSVLRGAVLTEIDETRAKQRTLVYAGGDELLPY